MRESGLCEISLGGFEVFDELTRIPIRRLTVMFGPNSAGKSSVEDGVRLLSEIICDGEDFLAREGWGGWFDLDHQSRRARLMRNWRRTSEKADSYAKFMQVGASALIDGCDNLLDGLFDILTDELAESYKPIHGIHRLEMIARFRDGHKDCTPRTVLNFILLDIAFLLDDVPFLEFSDGAEARLNFSHPLLSHFPIPEACKLGESVEGSHVSTEGGWLKIRGGMSITGQKQLDQRYFVIDWIYGFDEITGTPPLGIIDALRYFADIFDKVLFNSCRLLWEALKPYTVPASRSTPQPQHLSFLAPSSKNGRNDEHDAFHIVPPDYVPISVRFDDAASGARFGSHDVPG